MEKKKPVWGLLRELVDGQVISFAEQTQHRRRYRTVAVERKGLCGDEKHDRERLKAAGLSGRINTALVERINLTIRQCVSPLTRRRWGLTKYAPALREHLAWWRADDHFTPYHESLAVELASPNQRKGQQQPRQHAAVRYRGRTPAMAAGLTDRRWTVKELAASMPTFSVAVIWVGNRGRSLTLRLIFAGHRAVYANTALK